MRLPHLIFIKNYDIIKVSIKIIAANKMPYPYGPRKMWHLIRTKKETLPFKECFFIRRHPIGSYPLPQL